MLHLLILLLQVFSVLINLLLNLRYLIVFKLHLLMQVLQLIFLVHHRLLRLCQLLSEQIQLVLGLQVGTLLVLLCNFDSVQFFKGAANLLLEGRRLLLQSLLHVDSFLMVSLQSL